MAVVVVCVEPRGPVSPIGVLDIQMAAVMRREFDTAEPLSSEVELRRGRANGLVHVHSLPPWAVLFCPLFQSQFDRETRKRTIEHYTYPRRLRARERALRCGRAEAAYAADDKARRRLLELSLVLYLFW